MSPRRNADAGRGLGWLVLAAGLPVLVAGCGDNAPIADAGKPRRTLDSSVRVEQAVYVSGTPEQRLLGFLHARYGDNATLDGTWKDRWQDTEVDAERPVTRSVCARDTLDTDGQRQTLLAVCQTLDVAASVEPGRIDLYVLRLGSDEAGAAQGSLFDQLMANHPPLQVIAQRLQDQYGREGVPGTVEIEALGPQRHAFRIHHPWQRRGTILLSRTYIAVHSSRLREVALLHEHIDNRAAQDCTDASRFCDDTAFDIDFSITVGHADAVDGYWPLNVRARGQDCAGPAQEYHVVPFDPATRAYTVPEELQRTSCPD